jgi:hypothetical protein
MDLSEFFLFIGVDFMQYDFFFARPLFYKECCIIKTMFYNIKHLEGFHDAYDSILT